MAKTCPSCQAALNESAKRPSAWVPILTAVGVSAAALIVYQQVKRSQSDEKRVESALARCARAATALDRRIGESHIQLAS
jgi:hypothetical protein